MHLRTLSLAVVLILATVACGGDTYTQEELDAAIAEAVEQAVAEQTTTTNGPTTTTTPTTGSAPTTAPAAPAATTTVPQQLADSDPRSVPAISGNASPPLAVGESGVIGYLVAAHTPTSVGDTRVFVLLRNNTNDIARGVQAAVTMRDGTGQLLASGELSDVFPHRIEPGQIGFGEMFVSDVELPPDADFEFQWSTSEIPETSDDEVDLVIPEHTIQGGQIVAIVENNTSDSMYLVQAAGVCFRDDGGITWLASSFTDADNIAPGGNSPITIDMNDQPCPIYLVSAHGFRE